MNFHLILIRESYDWLKFCIIPTAANKPSAEWHGAPWTRIASEGENQIRGNRTDAQTVHVQHVLRVYAGSFKKKSSSSGSVAGAAVVISEGVKSNRGELKCFDLERRRTHPQQILNRRTRGLKSRSFSVSIIC